MHDWRSIYHCHPNTSTHSLFTALEPAVLSNQVPMSGSQAGTILQLPFLYHSLPLVEFL